MRHLALAVVLGLAVLAAGCGSDEEPGPSAPATPTPSAEPAAGLDGPLTYQRGGGLAGGVYRMVVEPGGQATITSPGVADVTFELSADERRSVADALDAAGVAGEQADYSPTTPVADGIGHRVSYAGGELVSGDGGDAPPAAQRLTAALSRVVDAHRRR